MFVLIKGNLTLLLEVFFSEGQQLCWHFYPFLVLRESKTDTHSVSLTHTCDIWKVKYNFTLCLYCTKRVFLRILYIFLCSFSVFYGTHIRTHTLTCSHLPTCDVSDWAQSLNDIFPQRQKEETIRHLCVRPSLYVSVCELTCSLRCFSVCVAACLADHTIVLHPFCVRFMKTWAQSHLLEST